MKKTLLLIAILISAVTMASAQKFGYVDTEYILNNIPSFKSAQEQIDKLSNEWQKEVEAKYTDIDKMYKNFQSEKVLLTDDMKSKTRSRNSKKGTRSEGLTEKIFWKRWAPV